MKCHVIYAINMTNIALKFEYLKHENCWYY